MGQCVCFGNARTGPSNAAEDQDQAGPSNALGDLAATARNYPPIFDEITRATRNFSSTDYIGQGFSARVYRGNMDIVGRRMTVAVKRLIRAEDWDDDYDREVDIFSRLNHPHIINLFGCCTYRDRERIIVYEFMPLRTLYDWLYARGTRDAPLSWPTRMTIGAGVAKGLSYLHNQANPRVIYTDLKPSKVLLDNGYHPKISGSSKALSVPSGDQSSTVSTNANMSVTPYQAPEVSVTNTVTPKTDVFSFGVLLLEIIAGTAHMDRNFVKRRQNFGRVADWRMNGQFPMAELVKAMTLVNHCIKESPALRPDMSIVEQGMRNLAGERNVAWPVELNTEDEQAESSSRSNLG